MSDQKGSEADPLQLVFANYIAECHLSLYIWIHELTFSCLPPSVRLSSLRGAPAELENED